MEEQQHLRRLKVKEVVEYLNKLGFDLTERAVRDEITNKQLRSVKIRNVHYVSQRDLEKYIRARETMPSDEGDLVLAG